MQLRIKFPLFGGFQDVFSRLTAVCCMLLPHNPYRLPQHCKRQVCGLSCSCKHRYLWVSPIFFEHYFCLNYMGIVRHWQPFWSRESFLFIGQCWYFNPQWTSEQAISKHAVTQPFSQLEEMRSYKASTYI